MSTNLTDDQIYSKVQLKKISEHKRMFGIPDDKSDLQTMAIDEYRDMSQHEAFFYVDHNGFLRHQFSGEVLAASKEQLDVLIKDLQDKRGVIQDALGRVT